MLGSKLDLFKTNWLDVVFDGKNKSYGAYQLRKNNGSSTTKALLIAGAAYLFLFFLPQIIIWIKGSMPKEEVVEKNVEVVLAPPPPVNPETPPPPPVQPPPPRTATVRMPPPIVKPDNQVRQEEPPTVEELKKATPGRKTLAGSPDAPVSIAAPVGEGPVTSKAVAVEDNKVYDFNAIETPAGFPGGQAAFAKFLGANLKMPDRAQENNVSGKVLVGFVVDKDGRLTELKILKGIGSGCDEEALRVLKMSPRWSPGIQNGLPVKMRFSIPINFTLTQ